MRTASVLFVHAVLTVCLAGCAATAPRLPLESTATAYSRQLYEVLDSLTDRYGARDQGPVQVNGFPYLRSNRFLASFADQLNDSQFET